MRALVTCGGRRIGAGIARALAGDGWDVIVGARGRGQVCRHDALAGRYLHAEHDDVDELLARADEVRERDLNAIRLRR